MERHLKKEIQTPMAQSWCTKTVSMIKWIQTMRFLMKHSLSLREKVPRASVSCTVQTSAPAPQALGFKVITGYTRYKIIKL